MRDTRLIDARRIGMAGHSFGGGATALAMAADQRIRAGADLDGTFFAPFPAAGLHHRPPPAGAVRPVRQVPRGQSGCVQVSGGRVAVHGL